MRRTTALRCAIAAITILAGVGGASVAASAAGTSSLTGSVFDDANRNGVRDPGEAPFGGRALQLVLPDGTWVAGGLTDGDGRYSLSGLADGSYVLRMGRSDWVALRGSYVPTTTDGLAFQQPVTLTGASTSDLGLRAIVRSRTLGAPISATATDAGTLVESYNDAVSADELAATLAQAGAVGGEAPSTTIRFDYQDRSFTSSSYAGTPGSYRDYRATVWVDWLSWVDTGDQVLFHEYGHAWAEYQERVVQQDGSFASYLDARGLTGDARLGTNVYWDPREIIAEDYRQLFGSATARAHAQANQDIPPAAQVAGLQEFLSTTYMTSPTGTTPAPEPTPAPTPDAPPAVTDLAVDPAPVSTQGTVSFVLSEQATVTVRILSSTGAVVRTLVAPSVRAAGALSTLWDRMTDAGRKAKAGTYVVVVDAVDAAGQAVQASFDVAVIDTVKPRRR